MRRRSKAIRAIASFYDLTPSRPEAVTAMLKHQYRALSRLVRQAYYRKLAEIERDYLQGKRYWCGD